MSIVPDILGEPEVYHVPNPAAGNPVQHTVDKSGRWLINHITFQFRTSALAGNRYPHCWFVQSGITFAHTSHLDAAVNNNLTTLFTLANGYDLRYAKNTNKAFMPLPRILQFTGTFQINIHVQGMDVADRLSDIYIFASFWHDH